MEQWPLKDVCALLTRTCEYVTLHVLQKEIYRCDQGCDLQMEKLSWIIQVVPIQSHESLKSENSSQLSQKDNILRRIECPFTSET